jgi:hemolysin III
MADDLAVELPAATGIQVPAATAADRPVRPRLRGMLHQYAFLASLLVGPPLVLTAGNARATVAAAVYAASVSGLFGLSALYHRVTWAPRARCRLRHLDHAMIFVLIAGTYTPIGLLVLEGALATAVLVVVWSGAVAGIALNLGWRDAPNWLGVLVYVALGWVAVAALPQLVAHLGGLGTLLLVGGGLAYSAGALVYGRRRPDPAPAVFGYHEVFHLLVIVGVGAHFAAITLAVQTAR